MKFLAAFAILASLTCSALALEYQPMTIDDFKLDKAKLLGKKINVTGYYNSVGEMSMLSSEAIDANPVSLQIHSLPRDQRKALLGCPIGECRIMVWGRVGRGFMGYSLAADRVQVLSQ